MKCYFEILISLSLLFSTGFQQVCAENFARQDSIGVTGQSCDTVDSRFNAKQLILPGSLIAIGAFGVENGWIKSICRSINTDMRHLSGGHHFRADNYIQYVPALSYIGLGEIHCVKSKHCFRDRIIITATSFAAMCAIVQPVKMIVRERRPDEDEFDSFPSGHTATAFMGAELLRSEYSTGIGIAAYGVACGVGFSRLYNNRHWLNDVIAGAGAGILSARIGIWMLPVWKRLFGIDRADSSMRMALLPSYNAGSKGVMLSGLICF